MVELIFKKKIIIYVKLILFFSNLLWVTISLAWNDNSESLSATHGYNVIPRFCLEWKIIDRIEIFKSMTNNFGVVFIDVVLVNDDELYVGSIFDDVERLVLVVDKRLWFSDNDNCFVNDDDVERVLNGLEPNVIH